MRATDRMPIHTVSTAIEPPLSEAAAEAWIPRTCFKNGPPSQIGVELELLVVDAHHPDGLAARYPRHRYPMLLRELAEGGLDGALTVEPGGQVELSSRPGPNLTHTVDAVRRDLSALRRRAARRGARLIGVGVDPIRSPLRITDQPRYVAMERYLDAWGPAGRSMMCSTASVQVNVEAGVNPARLPRQSSDPISPTTRSRTGKSAIRPSTDAPPASSPLLDVTARWEFLHAIGPALVAAFANSPRRAGRETGWKSTRQGIWLDLDPARTGVPTSRPGEDLESTWTRWVLDAPLMLVRRKHGPWTAPTGLTFRTWVQLGRAVVADRPPPTADDLAYHLTTLFPQVRPRGHLEVRYIDAQPGNWWTVPTAVIGALLDDDSAAAEAREACIPTEGRWRDAARVGVADPAIAAAATGVMQAAATALRRTPDNSFFAGRVEEYLERWTARGRCPADDPPETLTAVPIVTSTDSVGDEPR